MKILHSGGDTHSVSLQPQYTRGLFLFYFMVIVSLPEKAKYHCPFIPYIDRFTTHRPSSAILKTNVFKWMTVQNQIHQENYKTCSSYTGKPISVLDLSVIIIIIINNNNSNNNYRKHRRGSQDVVWVLSRVHEALSGGLEGQNFFKITLKWDFFLFHSNFLKSIQ